MRLSSLNGKTGFTLNGIDGGDMSGFSVSRAGDVDKDGYADMLIGAYCGDPGGEAYVVFGKSGSFGTSVDLGTLDGSDGFVLEGIDADDLSGRSVSTAGDVNGDGYVDILIGAMWVDPDNRSSAGEVYVVFGKKSGYKSTWDLDSLTDTEGFVIQGIDPNDYAGHAINAAGDVNNDGYDDIIIGSPGAASKKGETYVLFGGDFTGDSTVSSASADDSLSLSQSGVVSHEPESRDNPLTPGDTESNGWSGNDDSCIEYPKETSSSRGNGSDLILEGEADDSSSDDEENAV